MAFHGEIPADAKAYNLLAGDVQLARNFRLSEFASNDGTPCVLVHPALVQLLQALRDHYDGRVVRINSGFRTGAYNRAIGGASSSRHLYGLAADIRIAGVDPGDVAALAERWEVGGVGRYETFTHVDVWGQNRRWVG